MDNNWKHQILQNMTTHIKNKAHFLQLAEIYQTDALEIEAWLQENGYEAYFPWGFDSPEHGKSCYIFKLGIEDYHKVGTARWRIQFKTSQTEYPDLELIALFPCALMTASCSELWLKYHLVDLKVTGQQPYNPTKRARGIYRIPFNHYWRIAMLARTVGLESPSEGQTVFWRDPRWVSGDLPMP